MATQCDRDEEVWSHYKLVAEMHKHNVDQTFFETT